MSIVAWLKTLFSRTTRVDVRRKRGWYSDVVGETVANEDGTSRKSIIRQCRVGEAIQLVRVEDEHRPSKMIRVCRSNGEQIGYLDAYWAPTVARNIADGGTVTAEIAEIYNGQVRLQLHRSPTHISVEVAR